MLGRQARLTELSNTGSARCIGESQPGHIEDDAVMNELRRIISSAHQHPQPEERAAELSVSVDLLSSAGIPASANSVAYDSIQRLLLVRSHSHDTCT